MILGQFRRGKQMKKRVHLLIAQKALLCNVDLMIDLVERSQHLRVFAQVE